MARAIVEPEQARMADRALNVSPHLSICEGRALLEIFDIRGPLSMIFLLFDQVHLPRRARCVRHGT